jgi:hypothetical protein
MGWIRKTGMAVAALALTANVAVAQGSGWDVAVYPILVWVPLGIDINVDVPPHDGGSGGIGEIVEKRFDGAYLGGVSATNGAWRIDADAIWAAVGGDRVDRPAFSVDADLIYAHGSLGYRLLPGLFATGGFRRLALKYDVKFGDQGNFERKPGVWDPLIGMAYHRLGRFLDVHASFDAGGFGVGSDVDTSTSLRIDFKPARHFGLTAGYTILHFHVTNEENARTFEVKQTMHGPVFGIGLYF